MATKTFEAKIYVEDSGSPIPVQVQVQAQNITEATRFIKAQYGPRFKRFSQAPREVKK